MTDEPQELIFLSDPQRFMELVATDEAKARLEAIERHEAEIDGCLREKGYSIGG